ncbi:hypothetical protein CEXT_363661 [Caerostris extrusa]|uniref:Uncharacterized protein n=1 Tax=Caerostris extrusa TaxID=172846 RepID=A0AAV4XKH9_CAEEX|nr:hypothetical protein CEXT_363661 [Caerostris extrusa]
MHRSLSRHFCFVLAIGIISCVFLCRIWHDETEGIQNSTDPENTLGNSSDAEPVFVHSMNYKDDIETPTVLENDEDLT